MANDRTNGLRAAQISLKPPGEGAAAQRTLDERLVVRFPSLYPRGALGVMRMPVGSRIRSMMLARTITRAYAAANRRDFELILVSHDPRHEYRPARDLMPPDMKPVLYGHDGYLEMWQHWLDAFGDLSFEPEKLLDFGDKLLVSARQSGTGSWSGLALGESLFQLYEIRSGLVVSQSDFLDRDEALAAAAE